MVQDLAEEYVRSGRFLWNGGMFFFTEKALGRELCRIAPSEYDTYCSLVRWISEANEIEAITQFSGLQKTSIDYLLIERIDGLHVVVADFEWDDLGSWDAVIRTLTEDSEHNRVSGHAELVDSFGNVVFNASGEPLRLDGVRNCFIFASKAQVIVCALDRIDEIQKLAPVAEPRVG